LLLDDGGGGGAGDDGAHGGQYTAGGVGVDVFLGLRDGDAW
jgi:hypothetical protein